LLIPALASVWLCAAAQASIQPDRVLLVINRTSNASVRAAAEYAGRRGIPPGNQCLVEAPESASVDRATYERTIERPVADCLRRNQLHDQILVLVTAPGLPWLIQGDSGPFGDLASVDSELSLLYRRLAGEDVSPYGKVLNPYFGPELTRRGLPIFRREDMDIYLVGRLSLAGTADILPNEAAPPPDGVFAFDLASPRRTLLRSWLDSARELLAQRGQDVEYQDTGSWISPGGTVLGVAAEVPPADAGPPPPWRWSRGGTAVLMGDTWSEGGCGKGAPGAQGSGSCPPELAGRWLREGALAVLFQVADPGQDGYPRPQIFFPSLLEGLSVVEAAYLSTRYLSWRLVVLGDPLAVPFPAREPPAEPWVGRLDPATGLPEHFSRRRTQLLTRKYQTSLEAIATLLRAESEAHRGQTGEALRMLDQALTLDPVLGEAVLLKAKLLEEAGALEEAFAGYRRCLELGAGGEEAIQRKLAGLALERLDDPERALPHVGWLFQQKGLRDPEVIRMWLEVKLGTGDLEEAEALSLRLVRDAERPPALALETLGRVAEARGDYRTAAQFYRRALGAGDGGSQLHQRLKESERQASSSGGDGNPPETASPSVVAETAAEDAAEGAAGKREEVIRARVVQRTALEYPKKAALTGESGRVVLRLLIDERGQLIKVTPLAGPKSLVKAAEAAVRQWTFAPKTVGGRPEVDSINIAINFEIPEPTPPK
jgi:TonB family protein